MRSVVAVLVAVLALLLASCDDNTEAPPTPVGGSSTASDTVAAPVTPPDDAKFSEAARAAGLTVTPGLVTGAHAICTALRGGDPPSLVQYTVRSRLGWSADQATSYMAAATYAYCPDAI